MAILQRGQTGVYQIVGSRILELEMERMNDMVKRHRVQELYKVTVETVSYTEDIKRRSLEIMAKSKIRTFDSIHIASAEAAEADVMLTTDDKLEKMAMKLELGIKVMNPLKFAWEVI